MSLLVNNFIRTPDGKMQVLDAVEHGQDLAGFESYRRTCYGGPVAHALGLSLLPALADGDIYAEGGDVERLRTEATLALSNIDLFLKDLEIDGEHLRVRFENIIAACDRARDMNGGVVIW